MLAADNSFHVVTFTTAGDSSGLDGFIITNGNADSAGSYGYGGGIFNNGSGNTSRPVVSNCVITNNYAEFGGAIFNQGQLSGNASATFINCVFTADSAYYDGGAMYNSGLMGNCSPVITNCTFYGNNAGRNAGAIYDYGANGTCATTLLNSIIWGNTAGSGTSNQAQVYSSATDSVSYSLIEDSIPASMFDGGYNIFSDPVFAADTTPAGVYGIWFNEYNGLALKAGSPGVRAGRALGAPAKDIIGHSRIPVPDMGAYQLQDTAAVAYVSMAVAGCDSFLAPSYRYFWYNTGTYKDTTTNILGNDTFYLVNLTLGKTTYNTVNASTCSSYISPSGKTFDTSGVYMDTLIKASGCDSLITINLSIVPLNDTATANGATCAALQNNTSYQWINCNGLSITGATQQIFTATQNGNYACVVTLGNCVDTTNCVAVTELGITEIGSYHLDIYPNPTNGIFNIENNYYGSLKLQIYDAAGRNVKEFSLTQPVQQFNISKLSAGMYQVFITNGKQIISMSKIVLQ